MIEQTYMNLKDAVKRPLFNSKPINRDNIRFKKLVDSYQRWSEGNDIQEPRSVFEDDIIECLNEFDLDGYRLAEYLKTHKYIDPDSDLVSILDDVFYVRESLKNEVIKQWVKENFLTISDDVIGKKVDAHIGTRKFSGYFITSIDKDTYRVVISASTTVNNGYYVDFENVTFV
jgi:hypothetical protein